MSATVTVTGKAGAGVTVTATQFVNIQNVDFNCVTNILTLLDSSGVVTKITIDAAATLTATKSGSTYTFTIS